MHTRLTLAAVLVFAAALFMPGINWGLPSRAVDPFLFGDHAVWTGEEIDRLAPPESATGGADVDANPITSRDDAVVLNATDSQRAEIVRRYRLFSYQPDEMITFKSLSQIRQFHGDPRLYQYGGLWIYSIGAMLKAASIAGFVDVRADKVFYLDHPEAFGRFYIVARAYTLIWGLAGVVAVFHLTQRITARLLPAAAAAVAFACLPVVVNMAHEAKPHLPGTVLMLWAVIAALSYVLKGGHWRAALCGMLCGAAFGMVISAILIFALLPTMVMLRAGTTRDRIRALLTAGLAGAAVYAITNPFVLINSMFNRDVLLSNLGNSTAMYATSSGGIANAISLLAEGASPVMLVAGVVGVVALFLMRLKSRAASGISTAAQAGILLAVPASLVAIQFLALAAGKPAEYARFALFIDVVLAIAAIVAVHTIIQHRATQIAALAALLVVTGAHGLTYVAGFLNDARPQTSRLAAARAIQITSAGESIGLYAEPAPYTMPPVNLFDRTLLLLPQRGTASAPNVPSIDITLEPTDEIFTADGPDILPPHPAEEAHPWPFDTPMSWADKHFARTWTRGVKG